MTVPARPRVYHITHIDNLAEIVANGAIWSDAVMAERGGPAAPIGMSEIKRRRLEQLQVKCHPGDFVGEYVPFYFCPRSIMLYLIYMANHPELSYRGGQDAIVHLEADLTEVVAWADSISRRWAFTLSNAGAFYTEFRDDLGALGEVDWDAVENRDFRSSEVKEGKQAEFLMYESFPWSLVRSIGVRSDAIAQHATFILSGTADAPPIAVRHDWYY